MTVWETIHQELTGQGIEVYPPATALGECKGPYVVIKQSGAAQAGTFSSMYMYYDFIMYVPGNQYHTLEPFVQKVKEALATKLYPLLMPAGQEQPDFYDDILKAHMRSIMYRNNVRERHI